MILNNYNHFIDFYKTPLLGTGYLAFRDIKDIIMKHREFRTALDFGCGAGRSSFYLKNLGLEVTGTDINKKLIHSAINNNDGIRYYLSEKGKLPFDDCSFDVVFNSFVLCEMGSIEELVLNLKEMSRVCKNNGIVISVTNSDWLFNKNWLTVSNKFPENIYLKDGDIAKIYLKDVDIELYDYFWSEAAYLTCMKNADFKNTWIHQPLGKLNDPFFWHDESKYPPYSIYICSKKG